MIGFTTFLIINSVASSGSAMITVIFQSEATITPSSTTKTMTSEISCSNDRINAYILLTSEVIFL